MAGDPQDGTWQEAGQDPRGQGDPQREGRVPAGRRLLRERVAGIVQQLGRRLTGPRPRAKGTDRSPAKGAPEPIQHPSASAASISASRIVTLFVGYVSLLRWFLRLNWCLCGRRSHRRSKQIWNRRRRLRHRTELPLADPLPPLFMLRPCHAVPLLHLWRLAGSAFVDFGHAALSFPALAAPLSARLPLITACEALTWWKQSWSITSEVGKTIVTGDGPRRTQATPGRQGRIPVSPGVVLSRYNRAVGRAQRSGTVDR